MIVTIIGALLIVAGIALAVILGRAEERAIRRELNRRADAHFGPGTVPERERWSGTRRIAGFGMATGKRQKRIQ